MTSTRASSKPGPPNLLVVALIALCSELFFSGHPVASETPVDFSLSSISKVTATSVLHAEWNEILTIRDHYLKALEEILVHCQQQLTSAAAENLHKKGIPASDPPLDPWGGIDQKTGFVPQIDLVRWVPKGRSKRPDEKTLLSLIPHPFRLAEQIGLGRNSLHLQAQFIDPRFHSRVPYGFSVESRILHALFGTFTWQSTNQVETFRYQIESASRRSSATANFGAGVKPHHIGISQEEIEKSYNLDKLRAWEIENLQLRILNEGAPVGLSAELQKSQALNLKKLRLELRSILTQWAGEAEERTGAALVNSMELAEFMEVSSALRDWKTMKPSSPTGQNGPIGMGTIVESARELVSALTRPDQTPETLLQTHKYLTAVGAIHKLGSSTSVPPSPKVSQACLAALSELALHPQRQ